MEKQVVSRREIISQLLRIGHGKFDIYQDVGLRAVQYEPELFAHLIAWNHKNGEVRDTKVAFPVLALRGKTDPELYENAVAHLCSLDPRNLVKAVQFHKRLNSGTGEGAGKMLKFGVEKYVRVRQSNPKWWDRSVLQHRKSMKALYALYHIKPSDRVQRILFKNEKPKGSVFAAVAALKDMPPKEAAGTILNFGIPFNIAIGAVGGISNYDVLLALMSRMSGAELITNTKMLERAGVFQEKVLKAAYDEAMVRTADDKRVSTMKAGQAKKHVGKKAAKKLDQIQEDRLAKLGGIEGDWLILADKSSSMDRAVIMGREVAGLIAQQVKGKVHLIFFHERPDYFDATGKTLTQITEITKRQQAHGWTSIGCGLEYLNQKKITVNGIVVCTDGGENTRPYFVDQYRIYEKREDMQPPIFVFRIEGTMGHSDAFTPACLKAGLPVEKFELDAMDFYALPNIIKTLHTSRYTLEEKIMSTPLMTFNNVFEGGK